MKCHPFSWSSMICMIVSIVLLYNACRSEAHPNPYLILGVTRNQIPTQIKTAFQKLAKSWHPDKNRQSSEQIFQRIRRAYDVLSNPISRNHYDRIGRFPSENSNAFDYQEIAIQKYAAVGASQAYNRDPDRFSPSTLLADDSYPALVEDKIARFGGVYLVKVYSEKCYQCSSISKAWEDAVLGYQGMISFGRINFGIAPKIVRNLGISSLPQVFAVTPDPFNSQRSVTTLMRLDNPSTFGIGSVARFLSVISSCGNITRLGSSMETTTFLSSNHSTKILFVSRIHTSIPLPLIRFMHRRDLPPQVAFAFAAESQLNPDLRVLAEGLDSSTYIIVQNPPFHKASLLSELTEWYQLLCIDSDAVVAKLLQYAGPVLTELTYDTYYDACYRNGTICIVSMSKSYEDAVEFYLKAKIAETAQKLKTDAPVRMGWVNADQQGDFLRSLRIKDSYKHNGIALCVVKPSVQGWRCFAGSSPFDGDQARNWVTAAVSEVRVSAFNEKLPFLVPISTGSGSGFIDGLSRTVSGFISLIMYGALAGAAIFLFLGPSVI